MNDKKIARLVCNRKATGSNWSNVYVLSRLAAGFVAVGSAVGVPFAAASAPEGAPLAATWGGAEVHGGTAEQRSVARDVAAHLTGKPFVMDVDTLRTVCAGVRERLARPEVKCSLIFSNAGQAHYLVEVPVEAVTPAQTPPEAFDSADPVLPEFLVKLHDRFNETYQSNLSALNTKHYAVRGGRVYFGVPALDQISVEAAKAVPANTDAIRKVLVHGNNPEQRALAAFLIGWSAHPEDTLKQSLAAFHDPEETVRNNYSMMAAIIAPSLSEPFQQQLATYWCEGVARPVFTDRSKALLGLSRIQPKLRRTLPGQCKDTIAVIGRETALAEIRHMAEAIISTP
jgi:hypothetical protein